MTDSPKKPRLSLAATPEAEATPPKEYVFWLIWNPKRGNPSVRHVNEDIARAEAQRLANVAPGEHFYVLKAVSVTRMANMETISLTESGAA